MVPCVPCNSGAPAKSPTIPTKAMRLWGFKETRVPSEPAGEGKILLWGAVLCAGRAGQAVGPLGDTGLASSPTLHLHFLSLSVPARPHSGHLGHMFLGPPAIAGRSHAERVRLWGKVEGGWEAVTAGAGTGLGTGDGQTVPPVCQAHRWPRLPPPLPCLPRDGQLQRVSAAGESGSSSAEWKRSMTVPSSAAAVAADHVTTAMCSTV